MNTTVGKIIDITHTMYAGMPVYPKNPNVEIQKINTGHSIISKITLGTHTGTHIDAPAHVIPKAQGVDKIDLNVLVGPCKVIDMTACVNKIGLEEVKKENIKKNDRILFKTTNSNLSLNEFHNNYIYLDGDAADYLANLDINLIGIDYLSIKKKGGKDNRAHNSLLEKEIPILEGLNLKHVKAGVYFLISLPLKILNADGAPARIILIKN